MKKSAFFLLFGIFFWLFCTNTQASDIEFTDVPKNHWAFDAINDARKLGITNGIGDNKFGFGKNVTVSEFSRFLENSTGQSFSILGLDGKKSATREDMAIIIVNALGYTNIASDISKGTSFTNSSSFSDVSTNKQYISLVNSLNLMSGTGDGKFSPKKLATREEAIAIVLRIFNKINMKTEFTNGFYALKSSPQIDLINNFDSLSFGWSRIDVNGNNVVLNTTILNDNEYRFPSGYEEPLQMAKDSNKNALLMVTVADISYKNDKLINNILLDLSSKDRAIEEIVNGSTQFDGVVIDFENLKGTSLKTGLNNFISTLDEKLGDKLLYVAVQPFRHDKEYFDGYDFKFLGEKADKVILMAHDYAPVKLTQDQMTQSIVMTPLTPISEIYSALSYITDEKTGIDDKEKIVLQISFDSVQWKKKNSKVINEKPFKPDYETIQNRINLGVTEAYDKKNENPYLLFTNNVDGTQNIVWFENKQSVQAKIRLAKLFGVNSFSYWRIGNIPNDSIDFTDKNKG